MTSHSFRTGDIVVLKSNTEVKMTVGDLERNMCKVIWLDKNNRPQAATVYYSMLQHWAP